MVFRQKLCAIQIKNDKKITYIQTADKECFKTIET